jgi:serine/threonine protein phosphatase 1
MVFKRFFQRPEKSPQVGRSIPGGQRVYAIGDIHGRLDKLNELLDQIDRDGVARGPQATSLVFLGDLADRGPDSRGVIDRLIALKHARPETIFIMGNHEELFVKVWEGKRSVASMFNRVGGRETILSYGAPADIYDEWDLNELIAATQRLVPQAHINFLRSFQDFHQLGDYAFVHAGIRPGIDLEDQDSVDLRWIRDEFTKSNDDHHLVIVHGHSITPDVDEQINRIGIDTGAYATGVLTALGLEGREKWFLQTSADEPDY